MQLYWKADVLSGCVWFALFVDRMIPQYLTLKNFLSYQEATLDFRGLHTACICGPNGAGKSSLLEAIAWALWGQGRVATEDDIIHIGAQEAQVDFIFQHYHQVYRVIRTRQRGQATSLEFQIALAGETALALESGFRTLTERGMRATQELILQHLKLDYETFVNSAYLRQGRADEFMLKRPGERKQILADLLKLDQYDHLADQARDQARQLKGQLELLEQQLESIRTHLLQGEAIAGQKKALEEMLTELQQRQKADLGHLQTLQKLQHQRQTWEQQLSWQQQHQAGLQQDCQRLQQELATGQAQLQMVEAILQEEVAIVAGYAHWQTLQVEEEQQVARWQVYQVALQQQQQLQQQQDRRLNHLKDEIRQVQAQLEALQQQEVEIQGTLLKAADIDHALEQLQQARQRLQELDQLQSQVAPLLQRRQTLYHQLDRVQTRLSARLEEVQASVQQLQTHQAQHPQIEQAVVEISSQIQYLEHRKSYQQLVLEKGQERRHFMERLQEQQRVYETELAQLDQKIQLLKQPDATCPLCDRPLDEHHWGLVLERHRQEQEDLLTQLWVLREQLVVSEREIQVLRQEYRTLDRELTAYHQILEQRGQLQAQLHLTCDMQDRLQQFLQEQEELDRQLQQGEYAADVQSELRLLEQSLAQIWGSRPYDEKDHALARGEVDRWRWAEIKQVELKQAQRRQVQIQARRPELQAQLEALQQQMDDDQRADRSPLQRQLEELDRYIREIGYSPEQHNALRQALREAHPWQQRYQELRQAQHHTPVLQQRQQELTQALQQRQQDWQTVVAQMQSLQDQLTQTPDCSDQIQQLETQIQQQRSHLDAQLAELGRLQQQQQHLETLSQQQATLREQLQTLRGQSRIYQELSQAFGKNGIQALMIENVLPQLEAETNKILARLSANQLHIQFVTQRASKGKGKVGKSEVGLGKFIDTLDILIADASGTRPYETYSGGEAFRINFAIRLALSRLLAQQAGTALQLLIVDEGFGTQDQEGCDRLIAAINAIAADFACILMVTHMPHLKEAFQTRIEISKTESGSQIYLLI